MTREETVEYAIKFFNRRLREPVLQYGERQAIHIAISALREQEERSKGCDFCNADYAVMSGSYMTLDFQHKSITPKFCPKCGRRLEKV